MLAGLLDLKQILHLSRRRSISCSLLYHTYTRTIYNHPQQPEEFPIIILPLSVHSILWKTLKYWRITLLSFSVIFFFSGRHHIHKTDPSSTSETHLQQCQTPIFLNVQTGTVVIIFCVHLDMLLFKRRGLPVGLFYLVSTLQTMEHQFQSQRIFSEGTAVCGQATQKLIFLKDCSPQKEPVLEEWENCKE